MIWEAERAAKALEASAMRSPLAQACLLESRELIAQAIQSLNSIENGHNENGINPFLDVEGNVNGASQTDNGGGNNGFGKSNLMGLININCKDEASSSAALDSTRLSVNGLSCYVGEDENIIQGGGSSSNIELGFSSPPNVEIEKEEFATAYTGEQLRDQLVRLNGKRNRNELVNIGIHSSGGEEAAAGNYNPSYSKTSTKKWVCGRLVEIEEGRD